MSNLLIQDEPLLVPRKLAKVIGLNEALFLQQLHYWLTKSTHTIEGQKWVYNTYEAWAEQFPFWSISTIRRIISSLKERELIQTANFNKQKIDQTKWYAIQYDTLDAFENEQAIEPICTDEKVNLDKPTAQVDHIDDSTWTPDPVNSNTSVPKNTSKNTPEITTKIYKDVDESARVFRFFEENGFGTIGSFISEKISAWCTDLSDELVIMAMELAIENGCKTWKYVEAILRDWVDKGYQTRKDVEAAQLSFRKKKKEPPHTLFNAAFVTKLQHGDKETKSKVNYEQLKQELEEALKQKSLENDGGCHTQN